MEISFRRVKHEIWQSTYSQECRSLERIVIASGESLDYHRLYVMPTPETIVACIDNIDVGFAVIAHTSKTSHKWIAMFIDMKYQNLGIGKILYEKITEKIGDYGVTVVVNESQTRARKFFENRGFTEAYVSYFSDIVFNEVESKLKSYFANNEVSSIIKIEKIRGKMNEISEEVKNLVTKYNSFIQLKVNGNHKKIVEQNFSESNYVFDCTVIYAVREADSIIGLVTFSIWDDVCPSVEFLYVEPMEFKKDLLVRLLLVREFTYSRYKKIASHIGFFSSSLDLKSVNLLKYLNGELPYGRLTYILPSNDK